jgi:hypothetical protein
VLLTARLTWQGFGAAVSAKTELAVSGAAVRTMLLVRVGMVATPLLKIGVLLVDVKPTEPISHRRHRSYSDGTFAACAATYYITSMTCKRSISC